MHTTAPQTLEELTARGWEIVEHGLAIAAGELVLVTHWFVTPDDASVNADEHFGSDARTARFLGVVVPTLIDQLEASVALVAVPWGLGEAQPRLVLVAVLPDQDAVIEARALRRSGASAAPWWTLGEQLVEAPAELVQIAAGLEI